MRFKHPVLDSHISSIWAVCLGQSVSSFCQLDVSHREGVVVLHLPTEPLKTSYGLEPVLRCEPSTYQPNDLVTKYWGEGCKVG